MPLDEIRVIAKDEYPINLQNMKYPPRRLFVRGNFPAPKGYKYLCVVGSRKWTGYGRDAVYKIISGLKGYPVSIVSGLAIGIDSIAHTAALEAGLHCVAFPGSSLEWGEIYPPEHRRLAEMIVEGGGALLSRWKAGYATGKWAFPARNTLMAGLSDTTLVIEAAYRSGSLMTAKHAEEYGRDVLAVPGSIYAANSYGTHMLIRHGAGLVSSSEDLLEALGFSVSRKGMDLSVRIKALDSLSATIMDIVGREELDTNTLIEKTGMQVSAFNERLTMLELEGFVKISGGYVRPA